MSAVEWRLAATPRAPVGIAAIGPVARTLAQRLLRLDDAALADLRGVVGTDLLVCLGDPPPWVDGGTHFGPAPDAPGLFTPTWLTSNVHEALLAAAVARRAVSGPALMLPGQRLIVPLADARPIDRAVLQRWLES